MQLDRQHLRDTIYATCAGLNEAHSSTDIDAKINQVILSGTRLALELLEDGSARKQPKYHKLLTRLALQIIDIPLDKEHGRLAGQYKTDLAGIYQEELSKRLISTILEKTFGSWTIIIQLINKRVDWAENFGDQYWPEKPNIQLQLLKALVNLKGNEWLANKWMNIVPYSSPHDFNLQEYSAKTVFRNRANNKWFQKFSKFILQYQKVGSSGIRIKQNLTKSNTELFHFGLSSIEYKELYSLEEIPNLSEEWSPFIYVERYNRNPSAKNLAIALKNVNHDNILDIHLLKGSWPLMACLFEHKEKGTSLEELASKASNRLFGNLSKWQVAEKRWRENGITKEDIKYMASDDHWPYDQHIDKIGFPFIVKGMTYTYSPHSSSSSDLLSLIKEIHVNYLSLKSGRIKQSFADWLRFLLSIYGEERGVVPNFRNKELIDIIDIIDNASRPMFELSSLNVLSEYDWSDQNLARSLDELIRANNSFIFLRHFSSKKATNEFEMKKKNCTYPQS